MSPAVWSVDGVSACMLYSMVECRAGGNNTTQEEQGYKLQLLTVSQATREGIGQSVPTSWVGQPG